MRKLLIFTAVLTLPFLTAAGCEDDRVCKPGAIRQEVSNPEHFWVCKQDGSGETLLTGPVAPSNPKNNWG